MRIIHFSDFHLQGDQIDRANTIVDRMLEAIVPLHHLKPVDLIVFSGDLIDKAGKEFPEPKMENAYNQFKTTVIDRMVAELGLPQCRFVFSPGNHDVNRKAESEDDDNKLTNELCNQKALDIFIHKKDFVDKVPRIKEYNAFRDATWAVADGDVEIKSSPLQFCVKLKIEGKIVGLNCLNTAWRCYNSDKDSGRILTGKSQINDVKDFFRDCDIRFVLGHHVPSLMNHFEVSDLRSVITRNYDCFFSGHTHEEEGRYEARPEGSCFFFNAPGTLCANINESDPKKNGFMVVDYEQDDRIVEARWYWQNEHEDFVQNLNYAEHGVWKHKIPGSRIIKPMTISLFRQKREIGFLKNNKIEECLRQLRDSANKTIQFVALSGIGKTRVLQEAFDDGEERQNCYYCEYSDDEEGLLYDVVDLFDEHRGQEGLIVLDNCPNRIIEQVAAKRDLYESKFRVIGVNNDYYDRKRLTANDVLQILVNQDEMRDMVNEYIRQNTPDINGDTTVRDQIKRVSDGFPGMAIELVEAYKKSKDVDVHRVDYLVKKMLKFEAGHEEEQEIAMRTFALFKPFPYKDGYKTVYQFLRNNERITPLFRKTEEEKRSIFSHVVGLHEGALIECSESWLNVRPFPLAVWLVAKWFEADNDEDRMAGVIDDIAKLDVPLQKFLIDSMYERLRYMQDSVEAQDMIARLTETNQGSFCNEKVVCSDMGSRLFLGMSTVNPVAIARCLHHVLVPKQIDWLRENVAESARRNLVWALEKLCFEESSYSDAVWVLARLAVAENETWGNNASSQLAQLFHIALPGTAVSLEKRMETLASLVVKGEEYREVALGCFSSAFYRGQFVRTGDAADFGLERKVDYSPKTYEEIFGYWEGCRDLILGWLDKDETILGSVAGIIEKHALQWAFDGMLERMMPLIEKVVMLKGGKWEELYDVLRRVKESRLERIYTSEFLERYRQLIETIYPKTFCQKLKDARQGVCDKELNGGDIIAYERKIMAPLAKEFLDGGYYKNEEEVRLIVEDEQFLDIWFSPSLREIMTTEQQDDLLQIFLNIIEQSGKEDFRSGFMFRFCYDFRETEGVRNFFEKIIEIGYSGLYVRFLAHCETEGFASYDQLVETIKKGKLQEEAIDIYIDNVTIYTKEQILGLLIRVREEFPGHITSLMSFVVRRQYNEEFYSESDVQPIVKQLVLDYSLSKDGNANLDFEYARFVAFLLEKTHDEAFAIAICHKVIDAYNAEWMHDKYEGIFTALFRSYIDVIWDIFVQAFVSDEKPGFYIQVRNELGSGIGFGVGPMFQYGDDRIKEMCRQYPDKAPIRVSEMIPVFDSATPKTIGMQENIKPERFSDLFLWLVDNFANQEGVLEGLHANLGSYSWTGSVIPLLKSEMNCFEQIKNHENLVVREWVERCLNGLKMEYSRERNHEEYMRLRYS